MAERLNCGDLDLPQPDKRRPVLILSRPSLIPLLHTGTVAAITSTLRGAPAEVELVLEEGQAAFLRQSLQPLSGQPAGGEALEAAAADLGQELALRAAGGPLVEVDRQLEAVRDRRSQGL